MTLLMKFLVKEINVEMHLMFIFNVWCNVFTILEPADFTFLKYEKGGKDLNYLVQQ